MLLLLLCHALAAPAPARAEEAPKAAPAAAPVPALGTDAEVEAAALRADIERLLALTGSTQLATQMIDQMITSMRASMPQVPPDVWSEIRKEMHPEDLVAATVSIYARHFTRAEIAELITFYESPIGRKLIAEQPAVLAESMTAGQEWGVKAANRAMAQLKARGLVF